MILVNYVVSVFLVVLGLYCVCTDRHLIKIVLGLGVMDYGVNLFIVSIGFNDGGTAPIYNVADIFNGVTSNYFVDPVPQALTLTSIVIGACVQAMALSLVIMLYKRHHSVYAEDIRRLRG